MGFWKLSWGEAPCARGGVINLALDCSRLAAFQVLDLVCIDGRLQDRQWTSEVGAGGCGADTNNGVPGTHAGATGVLVVSPLSNLPQFFLYLAKNLLAVAPRIHFLKITLYLHFFYFHFF